MKTLTATVFLILVLLCPVQAKGAQRQVPWSNSTGQCVPPAVVASFLGFTEAQTSEFVALLGQLQPTLQGLEGQIVVLQTQLDILLSQPSPNPAILGNLLLQIHALEQQVAEAIQSYQSKFVALLTEVQKQKVQAVTQASQLQPVVGAFVALKLAPPPTPLPCQNQ